MHARHMNYYFLPIPALVTQNVCVPYGYNHVTVTYVGHPGIWSPGKVYLTILTASRNIRTYHIVGNIMLRLKYTDNI